MCAAWCTVHIRFDGPSARAAPFSTELRRLHGTARASGLAYFRRPVQLDARARHALESLEPSVAAAGTAHRCRMACATQPDTWHAPCNVRVAAVGLTLRRVRSLPTFVGKGRHTTAERQTQTPLWAVLQWRQANRPTARCNSVRVMEFCWMCSDCSAARAQRSELVPDSQPVGYSLVYLNTCALTRPEAQPTHSAAAPTAVCDLVVRLGFCFMQASSWRLSSGWQAPPTRPWDPIGSQMHGQSPGPHPWRDCGTHRQHRRTRLGCSAAHSLCFHRLCPPDLRHSAGRRHWQARS